VTQILPWLLQRIYKKTADDFESQKKQTAVSLQIYRQLLSTFDVLDPGSAAKIAREFQTKQL
jgi:hypothetical protein